MISSFVGSLLALVLSTSSSVSYNYDALGRLTLAIYPDGKSIEYRYDANGNRTEILINGGDPESVSQIPARRLLILSSSTAFNLFDSSLLVGMAPTNTSNSAPSANYYFTTASPGEQFDVDANVIGTDPDDDVLTFVAADQGTISANGHYLQVTASAVNLETITINYTITDGEGLTASNVMKIKTEL